MSTIDDTALLERWKLRRDADAFAELVSRHAGMVYATCRRVLRNGADAEDTAQECFLELVDAPSRLRSVGSWLHTIAVRRSIDLLRKRRRRRRHESSAGEQRAAGVGRGAGGVAGGSPDGCASDHDESVLPLVDEAIAALPEKLRTPLVLRFLEGRTLTAVAAELGLPASTVRSRLDRGVEKVRSRLRRNGVSIASAVLASFLSTRLAAGAAPPSTLVAGLGKFGVAGGALAPAGVGVGVGVGVGAGVGIGAALMKLKIGIAALAAALLVFVAFEAIERWSPELPEPVVQVRPEPVAAESEPGDGVLAATVPAAEAPPRDANAETTVNATPPPEPPSPRLAVRCFTESGEPIEDAEVWFVEVVRAGGDATPREYGPVLANAEGVAVFEEVARDPKSGSPRVERAVYARLAGVAAGIHYEFDATRRSASGGDPGDTSEFIDVVLTAAVVVAGEVEVPAGYRVGDVTVRLAYSSNPPAVGPHVKSLDRVGAFRGALGELFDPRPNADGSFELPELPRGGRVMLTADAPELGPAEFSSSDPEALGAVKLVLEREGALAGTLVYRETDRPAGGVLLVAKPRQIDGAARTPTVRVDDDGAFVFRDLAAGPYTIALASDAARDEWTMPVRGLFQVRSGEILEGIELELERGALVSGRVIDETTGEPIAGVGVSAVNGPTRSTTSPVGHSRTGDDGAWSILLPSGDSTVYLSTIPVGFARERDEDSKVVTIAPDEHERGGVDFVLRPGEQRVPMFLRPLETSGTLRGRVVDERGAPLADIEVAAERQFHLEKNGPPPPWTNPQTRVRTDADGRFELAVAAGKPHLVRARATRWSTARSEKVEVADGATRTLGDLRLRRGTSSIAGVVVDESGEPIAGVEIVAKSPSKSFVSGATPPTTSDGRFRVDWLMPDETVELKLHRLGYETVRTATEPDVLDLRLTMARAARGTTRRARRESP